MHLYSIHRFVIFNIFLLINWIKGTLIAIIKEKEENNV